MSELPHLKEASRYTCRYVIASIYGVIVALLNIYLH